MVEFVFYDEHVKQIFWVDCFPIISKPSKTMLIALLCSKCMFVVEKLEKQTIIIYSEGLC